MTVAATPILQDELANRVRRVAILLASLEPATAQILLARLSPEQLARVEHVKGELATISEQERMFVIREFLFHTSTLLTPADGETSGAEVSLEDSLSQLIQTGELPDVTKADAEERFAFLNNIPLELLGKRLEQAESRVVAIVIAHLDPQRAAQFLLMLPSQQQADILRQVTDLHEAESEMLDHVARDLKASLEEELSEQRKRKQGMAIVQSILQAAGHHRRALLSNLAQHGGEIFSEVEAELRSQAAPESTPLGAFLPGRPELETNMTEHAGLSSSVPKVTSSYATSSDWQTTASAPVPLYHLLQIESSSSFAGDAIPGNLTSSRPVRSAEETRGAELTWDDLLHADDGDLMRLLQEAEPRTLIRALGGSHPALVNRFCQQLSDRESLSLRQRIESTRHLRLEEVRQAQRELLNLAKQLCRCGVNTC
jgi:flagellar motor switch protein FliG